MKVYLHMVKRKYWLKRIESAWRKHNVVWLDAYWSKDIQTLFRLERRASFQKFFELLLARKAAGSLRLRTLQPLARSAGRPSPII